MDKDFSVQNSIPSQYLLNTLCSNGTLYNDTWSPEKVTMRFTSMWKPLKNSLFVPVRKSPTQKVRKRLPHMCDNGKSMRIYGFYSQTNQLLTMPISTTKKKTLEDMVSLKWNDTHENTLHLNKALWFVTHFT